MKAGKTSTLSYKRYLTGDIDTTTIDNGSMRADVLSSSGFIGSLTGDGYSMREDGWSMSDYRCSKRDDRCPMRDNERSMWIDRCSIGENRNK